MKDHHALRVRSFQAPDERGAIDLLEVAFAPWLVDIDSVSPTEFFHWKHRQSPFGPSTLLVVEADDELIGFAAYMPWRLRAHGEVRPTLRGVDFAVHPAHRRRGATMALRATANSLSGAAFIWSNPNEATRRGGLKSGRKQIGTLPRFFRPCAPAVHTIRRLQSRGAMTPQRLTIEAEPAAEALRDEPAVSELLASTERPSGRLSTVKDLDFLRWRYGRLREYRAVRIDAPNGGSGLAIFRPRRFGPLWVLDVCELLVERGDRTRTRALLRRVSDTARADFIHCGFPSRRDAAVNGFLQARHGTTLMTRPLRADLAPDPTRSSSWSLSRGDIELV
jgi:GNAT superfamily N-acetyltransferase